MLLLPSWGGMINGIMTLSGAWDKLRTDPIMRFMIVALSFYGMSTFEGPMMSLKDVNALSHYTDWTVGHVHSGALGWVAMISFGSLYHLIPKLWDTRDVQREADRHPLLARTIGVLLYITAMWISGIMQGLMWRAFDDFGTLTYSFVESVKATIRSTPCADRRHAVLPRHVDHGLQRLDDDPRRKARARAGAHAAASGGPAGSVPATATAGG